VVTNPHPTPHRPARGFTRRFFFHSHSYLLFPPVIYISLYSSLDRCRLRAPFRLAIAPLIPAVSRTAGWLLYASPSRTARLWSGRASSARLGYSIVASPPSLFTLAPRRSRPGPAGRAPSRRPCYGSYPTPPRCRSLFLSPLPPSAAAATPPPHQVRSRPAVVPFQWVPFSRFSPFVASRRKYRFLFSYNFVRISADPRDRCVSVFFHY
jgi:hypothetical protein